MKYENILILRSNINEKEISEEIKRITNYFKNHSINLVSFENLGEKTLIYEIENNKKGLYFQTIFDANQEEKESFENFMKDSNNFMKQITIRLKNAEEIIFKQIKELNDTFLLKGIANEVVTRIQSMNEDGRNIPLDLDEIIDIANKIIDHDYFNETMNGIIDNYLDDGYPEKEEVQGLEE